MIKAISVFWVLNILLWGGYSMAMAQYQWKNPLQQETCVVRGRFWQDELKDGYKRLPQRFEGKVTEAVWKQSTQSAGLSVVFRSNAEEIKIRYQVNGSHSFAHMPSTGVSGVDMYATDANGVQRWCACSMNFAFGDTITYTYSNLSYVASSEQGYEYTVQLPLYNVVTWLEIGVPDNTTVFELLPVSDEKPMVVYGTSIAQGACASRPGMAWANIVGRELKHSVINLGFSGSARLEKEVFEALSEINAKLYILDCMPNNAGEDAAVVYERMMAGVQLLRSKNDAPILLVEHSGYVNEFSSEAARELYQVSNIELRKVYKALLEQGYKDIHYLTKEEIGLTQESMVEGIHPNDLGMRIYADAYLKRLKEIFRAEYISSCNNDKFI